MRREFKLSVDSQVHVSSNGQRGAVAKEQGGMGQMQSHLCPSGAQAGWGTTQDLPWE
jgi:hypothetical protein